MIDWKSRIRKSLTAAAGEAEVVDEEIIDELASHAAAAYQTARSNNCSQDEALQSVDELIGEWAKDAPRMTRRPRRAPLTGHLSVRVSAFAGIVQEVRYASRLFRRQPGHAIAVILIMALGIGATTTLFSVAYGVLLKPLPWPQAERLVRLQETRPGATRIRAWTITNASFLSWREQHSTVDEIAGWSMRSATLTGAGAASSLSFAAVSSNLFGLLSASPLTGGVFQQEDEIAAPNVIVLSYGLWQQEFGQAQDVVGRTIQLDGKPYTVIGVMGRSFAFPDPETRAWIPLYVPTVQTPDGQGRRISVVNAMARLNPGVSASQAAVEATARARSAPDLGLSAIAMFGTNTPPEISAVPVLQAMTAEVRPAIIVFLVAVGLLLVTATANVASLQLARSTARNREMAIRSAIGASTIRLTRQLVTESLSLGIGGGLAGLAFAATLHAVVPSLLPANFPRLADIGLNLPVVLFAALITVIAAIGCGVWPALHLRGLNVVESLTEQGAERVSSGRRTQRARRIVMTGQIAIACMLLIGAALLGRSFWSMLHADRGYDPTNLLTANLPMPSSTFTPARRALVITNILDRLAAMPRVLRAAATDSLQFKGFTFVMTSFEIPATADAPKITVSTLSHTVSMQYFATLGMRVVEGRDFTNTDNENSQPVILINRTFQRQYLKNKSIGAMLPCSIGADRQCEVIGVVDDVQRGVDDPIQAERFLLDRQWASRSFAGAYVTFIARTSSDPRLVIDALKAIVHEQDSSLALDSILSMEDRVSGSLSQPRLYAVLLGGFGLFALTIAAAGLFGVLSYTVAQRSTELALRTALGARRVDIVRLVVQQAMSITIVGLLAGTGVSLALVTYLSSFLYGVTTRDALTFVSVPLVVVAVAATACVLPALRAVRIDPLQAIRGR